jgi:hypothetical protein
LDISATPNISSIRSKETCDRSQLKTFPYVRDLIIVWKPTPLVSGSQKARIAIVMLIDPNIKYAPYGVERSITGVALETAKLWTQWTNEAKATLYALNRFVGISEA